MASRCAAVGAALVAVGRATPERTARLELAAARLREAAAAVTLGEAQALAGLASAIVRHAHDTATVDGWVARVGVAFAAADPPTTSSVAGVPGDHRGTTVEVFGDLATARHIAIVVPGMGTTTANAPTTLGVQALHLYEAARALDPDTAVIAWLGYDTPGYAGVLLDDDAEVGGRALAAFVAALPRRGDADVTVVAHSYGSLVAADAVRGGMRVDDVAVVGSPGLEADTVAALPLGDADLFAERAPFDVVALSEAYGRDPSDPRFGATRLATGAGVSGHSAYFDEGTLALANLAAVVVQRDDLLVVDRPNAIEGPVALADDAWKLINDRPLDAVQSVVAGAHGLVDDLEDQVPSGPWDGALAAEQGVRDATVEEAERMIDVVQRIGSPDAVGDVVSDLWDALND
ncbi:MAG: alpha/beta hydrolase [Acidimicrobiales bacterium]